MKHTYGLLLALGLGVAGALFNFAYLMGKSQEVRKVEFIGVAPDMVVDRGERLTEEMLVPVGIPAAATGNLEEFAIRYGDKLTVVGMPVWRELTGGSLLLREYLKTPPQELKLGEDPATKATEAATWVPVDTRTFVPSLVVPGDRVSFIVSDLTALAAPTEPQEPGTFAPRPAQPAAGTPDLVGPFKVLSLGNRLGSAEVMRAAKVPQMQENVMTISVKLEDGALEPKAEKLMRYLQATRFRGVGVLLHPRDKAAEPG
jgi:hypothetical protein